MEPGMAPTASTNSSIRAVRMLVSQRQKALTALAPWPARLAKERLCSAGSQSHLPRPHRGPQPVDELAPHSRDEGEPDEDEQRPAQPRDPGTVAADRAVHPDQAAEAQR